MMYINKRGVIDTRKLFESVAQGKEDARTKSVLTPFAQSTKLCDLGNIEEIDVTVVSDTIERMKITNTPLYYVAYLQYAYGLRVSEVLRIRVTDVLRSGRVNIKGLKGSNDRIVYCGEFATWVRGSKSRTMLVFDTMSRYYVYREYKKLGLIASNGEKSNRLVTHLFRHLAALELRDNDIDIDTTASLLGHKNKSNTKIYRHE